MTEPLGFKRFMGEPKAGAGARGGPFNNRRLVWNAEGLCFVMGIVLHMPNSGFTLLQDARNDPPRVLERHSLTLSSRVFSGTNATCTRFDIKRGLCCPNET